MAASTSILINIGAQTASAIRGIQGVNKALGDQASIAQKSSASIKRAAVPAAAAFTAVAAGVVSSVSAAEEAASANAKLAQVFKSMGLEQNTQAALDYAEALSAQIGVDDEIIKGAQTQLATFSEVAKSATLMGEATKTAADLAAAGFGTMDSASVMLGKALQDPAKGMTALSKVGVTFTKQQQEQIKAMQKTGDIAGAQAIVMEALKTQVGGVAEASATSSSKMSVAFGEVSEAVGGALLPAFQKLTPLLLAFATWASENSTLLAVIAGVIGTLAAAVLVANAALAAWSAITAVWSAVTTVATAVGGAFAAVMSVLTAPVLLVIAAIVALVAIVVLLWKNWDTVTKALGAAWDFLWAKAVAVFGALTGFFSTVWNGIRAVVVGVWNSIKAFLAGVLAGIAAVIRTYVNAWRTIITTVLNAIRTIFTSAWNGIRTGVVTAFNLIRTAVTNGIRNVLDLVGKLPGQILSALGNFGSLLYNKGRDLISGLIDGIKSMAGAILRAISNLIPGPLRRFVPGLNSLSAPAPAVAGMSAPMTTSTVIVNWYGGGASDARVVKRILEADDLRQGRPRGAPLRVAW